MACAYAKTRRNVPTSSVSDLLKQVTDRVASSPEEDRSQLSAKLLEVLRVRLPFNTYADTVALLDST